MNNQNLFDSLGFVPEEQENKEDVFASFGFVPEQQPIQQSQYHSDLQDIWGGDDIEREVERGQAQMTSRALEGIFGTPGNIESLINIPLGREKTIFPTSQNLQEVSEKATLGFTTPKSYFEKGIGELTQDIVGASIPLGGAPNLFRMVGIPLAGYGVKAALEGAGVDEKKSTYGKIGAMVALDLISRRFTGGGVRNLENDLWTSADRVIPENAVADASKLSESLEVLERNLTLGGSRPSTGEALKKINEIQSMISDGNIPVKSAMEFRKSINEVEKQVGAFSLKTPPVIKKKIIANLDKVKNEIVDTLKEYGKKKNPAFLKPYLEANEVSSTLGKSNAIFSLAKEYIPGLKSQSAKILLGGAVGGAGGYGLASGLLPAIATVTPKAIALGVPAYVLVKGIQILNRVYKSPTLRRFYVNALKVASAGNVEKFARNLTKLDSSLEKQEADWDFIED